MEGIGHTEDGGHGPMSLKAFHVLFIAVCILLAMFVGGWGVRQYMAGNNHGSLALGIFFFAFGFVLLGYGLKFIRKVEELGL